MSECKHDFDKPEAKSHTVNCKLCGEEYFIDDYYFWLSAREKEKLKKEKHQLQAKLGAIGALMKEQRYDEALALLPPNCEQVVKEIQAEAVMDFFYQLTPSQLDCEYSTLHRLKKAAESRANQLRNPEQEK